MRTIKGQIEGPEQIFVMLYVLFVVVVFIACIAIFSSYSSQTGNAELAITANRIIIESSFHEKDTGRVHIGKVDDAAFSTGFLDRRIDYHGEKRLGAKLYSENRQALYNERMFVLQRPKVGLGASMFQENFYINNGGRLEKARIEAVT